MKGSEKAEWAHRMGHDQQTAVEEYMSPARAVAGCDAVVMSVDCSLDVCEPCLSRLLDAFKDSSAALPAGAS